MRRGGENPLAPSTTWGRSQRMARKRAPTRSCISQHLDLGFLAFRTGRSKFLPLEPLSLWLFIIAAQVTHPPSLRSPDTLFRCLDPDEEESFQPLAKSPRRARHWGTHGGGHCLFPQGPACVGNMSFAL